MTSKTTQDSWTRCQLPSHSHSINWGNLPTPRDLVGIYGSTDYPFILYNVNLVAAYLKVTGCRGDQLLTINTVYLISQTLRFYNPDFIMLPLCMSCPLAISQCVALYRNSCCNPLGRNLKPSRCSLGFFLRLSCGSSFVAL